MPPRMAPLLMHQLALVPCPSRAASSPEGRSVGVPCERSCHSSTWLHLLAFVRQLGAPAYCSSRPSAPCSTDQHQHECSDYEPDQRVLWQWWWSRRIAHGGPWSILAPLEQL